MHTKDQYLDSSVTATFDYQEDVAPSGLTIGGATNSSLEVSWNAVTAAVDYEVYRDTSSTGLFATLVHDGPTTSFSGERRVAGRAGGSSRLRADAREPRVALRGGR